MTTEPARGRAVHHSRSLSVVAVLPALTCLLCPVCLTTGAGILSSLGVGIAISEGAHLAILAAAVAVAIGGAAWLIRLHRRATPLVLTVAGGAALLAGCVLEHAWVEYAGTALMLGGAIVNWRLGKRPSPRLVGIRRRPSRSTTT